MFILGRYSQILVGPFTSPYYSSLKKISDSLAFYSNYILGHSTTIWTTRNFLKYWLSPFLNKYLRFPLEQLFKKYILFSCNFLLHSSGFLRLLYKLLKISLDPNYHRFQILIFFFSSSTCFYLLEVLRMELSVCPQGFFLFSSLKLVYDSATFCP